MGKYSKYQLPKIKPPPKVHPIWRGIGCMLWILIPLISYASAVLLVGSLSSRGMLPAGLLGHVRFADWAWKSAVLFPLARFVYSLTNLWAVLIFFLVLLIIMTGVFTTLYSLMYRYFGPPRYTPLDAPQAKYKREKGSGRNTLSR
jgi:hypothetical protein